ncbi:T-complex protein 1 zeta subunit, putative [Babesia bigemina]|uniref:T-complex protein 1 zeta subunit, putative n=1 Tax=Babesia bigemina TaxID=5866 RepID=A0A061DBH4_BABBI|nr:T-complex protein 1 zeta subunit, putative [Babesia bigemina]CDR97893.1 T-complex protein 1 zeta subunit, putative [Babesia bigemina]|eukprot:XP_012770079.1 T-complex protein 1 zeta subunit, putative [Babesia bigemina]
MSVNILNKQADSLQAMAALATNIHAAKSLCDIVKTNLGPKGTCKMLVNGAGNIKITKDGSVLLGEMMIQHPTAMILCRAASAMDEITGDGTTSNVMLSSNLMKNSEEHILYEGVHPKFVADGFGVAVEKALKCLEELKVSVGSREKLDWEILASVSKTCACTKLPRELALHIAHEVVEAVKLIYRPDQPVDLFMVEVLHMRHRLASETQLVRGMVLDHGSRHPDMPKRIENVFILTLNCSLEYERSEVHSGFSYSSAKQRERLVTSERKFTDDKVQKIIDLKRMVCPPGSNRSFCVLNQKGIDPPALDLLARDGIMALRRVKRRNMERLTLCCGGTACNSVEDLKIADLGFAEKVYEQMVGEEKYTFVEGVSNPRSCTLLIKGSSDYSIAQIKDAVRDCLRAVKNAIDDGYVLPGAGATELHIYNRLMRNISEVKGKARYGVQVFAESVLAIPKTLADNAGLDGREVVLELLDIDQEYGRYVGLDLDTGKFLIPAAEGIWDNYSVKKQTLTIATTVAQQTLLVDEIIKAGRSMSAKPT